MRQNELRKVHFLGVSGSGMRPLAEISHRRGIEVSGTDQNLTPACLAFLSQRFDRHSAANLSADLSAVVFSSAIAPDNQELRAARELGLLTLHRSEYLRLLSDDHRLIAVAGTHGKTTTTALIAHLLETLGYAPTACIGGTRSDCELSSYAGTGDYFVAEVDESDGSFLNFKPFIAIINNIDLDHLDFYKDLAHIQDTFQTFARQTADDGGLVLNWDDPNSQEIAHSVAEKERLVFGRRLGSDIRCLKFTSEQDKSTLDAMVLRERVNGVIPLIGQHNMYNVLCALAVGQMLGIKAAEAAAALTSFPGVRRRSQCLLRAGKSFIYDDYAHNPGKVAACIGAVADSFADSEVIAVFEPHRFSRVKTMYNEFSQSFSRADKVFLCPLFAAGEKDDGDYDSKQFAQSIASISNTVCRNVGDTVLTSVEAVLNRSVEQVFVFIGAGNASRYAHQLRARILEEDTS